MRFVLDVNVFVSGLLSRNGAPAALLQRWRDGDFELVVSEQLLAELDETLRTEKLRKRVPEDAAARFVALIRDLADVAPDPVGPPPASSADPADDYLVALAAAERAHLVSGDAHLLALGEAVPVLSPRRALELLD